MRFRECFLRNGAGETPAAGLDNLVDEFVAAARTPWPDIALDDEVFVAFVADRLPQGVAIPDALARVRAGDLYLACACAQGDPLAIGALEATYFRSVDTALRRLGLAPADLADAKQALRQRLFVPPRKIAAYSGQGGLDRWLWVTAVRDAMRRARKTDREIPTDGELGELASPADDPDLALIKDRYQSELRQAFADAMGALASRDRNLLRYQLVDGLSIDEIGAIYRINRSSAARRLASVRSTLATEVRRIVIERLAISDDELQSAMRLVRSELDLSILRNLGGETPVPS